MIDLEKIFDELFPITRSITGEGYRQSIAVFARHMDLTTHRYPSGSKVFDWTVPKEWNIESARLEEVGGRVICDLTDHNLHVLNYSVPVDRTLSLAELQPHLHSIADQPELIPYVTSYYKEAWGFCLPHKVRDHLRDVTYRAKIDSKLSDGFVEVADATIKGSSDKIFFLSSYLCHPSLANNELSGPLVLLGLYERLRQVGGLRLNYRFLLNPETIGSLCYLSTHGDELLQSCVGGLVLTCLGGPEHQLSYKLSRSGGTLDKLMLFAGDQQQIKIRPFNPAEGSDERQLCSPGFNLPIGQMARTVYVDYKEYHTSGDTKLLMDMDKIYQSVDEIFELIMAFDKTTPLSRTEPRGEPQLGKRDLMPNLNSHVTLKKSSDHLADDRVRFNAICWILNYADGNHDIVDIARRSGMSLSDIALATDILVRESLVYRNDP